MPALSPEPSQAPDPASFRSELLGWYDGHARVLPWRRKGGRQDPYKVWLSEIMLQQTTVAAVIPYFIRFTTLWLNVNALAAADSADVMREWAGLGYYARARNLHKCAKIVSSELGGLFPACERDLRQLPGIGDYTAAAIAAIAFDLPAAAMDGNVERVLARWRGVRAPLPGAKKEIRAIAALLAPPDSDGRPGDYTQALMDLGATVCTPAKPKCSLCPVSGKCIAFRSGEDPGQLPVRAPRTPKPRRSGFVYWVTDESGRVLIQTREHRGLLGGMRALPVSDWGDEPAHPEWLLPAMPEPVNVSVRHVFSHFELRLSGYGVTAGKDLKLPGSGYRWVEATDVLDQGLPGVFRKAALQFIDYYNL